MYKYSFSLLLCLFTIPFAFGQTGYRVITIAGDTVGYRNGKDTMALFNSPTAIAVDTVGNLYVADTYNNVIRKIWKNDSVTTLAGNDTVGYRNGPAATAEFNMPLGVCTDRSGNIYVADTYNNVIRKIDTAGTVTTYAGTGLQGFKNGPADSAEFYLPVGVAADTLGDVFVTDNGNYAIREIAASGTVTTVAGTGSAGLNNGAGDTATFNGLYGITVNDSGAIYVTEYINNDMRRISNGIVSSWAGLPSNQALPGYKDGKSDSALFDNPTGIVSDNAGNLYVCDEYNNRIREISNGNVSTLAGSGAAGYVDSVGTLAEFNRPYGIVDYKGVFYVADNGNNKIRKMVSFPLGIEFIYPKVISMLVYPNPCTDKLMVASAPSGRATLLDVTGKAVWNNNSFKAPYVIPTGRLASGMYFLKITNASGYCSKQIVVEH